MPTEQVPAPLAIFYGWPSLVEHAAGNVDAAASTFARYGTVVFGDGLQDPSHPDHARTAAIIAALSAHAAPTSVHGYVTLGVRGANLPLDEIRRRVTAWKSLGVAGIFLDEAGYDRTRWYARCTTRGCGRSSTHGTPTTCSGRR
jgi:hypothetical protein